MHKSTTLIAILSIFLAACQDGASNVERTLPPPQVFVETMTPVPTPTITPTPVPLPILIHPYTIEGMRERTYSKSAIHLRAVLARTESFTRYAIDYLSDGLTITGILQVPPGDGPFPVIVMNHGYFDRGVYVSGDGTDRVAEVLNRAGYITVASDYRTWGKSDEGPSLFYTGLATDVISLINAVPTIDKADPRRIGLWGHSMGGGVTTKVLTIDSDARIRAAVLYAPTSADDFDIISAWGYGCIGPESSWAQQWCNSSDVLPESLGPQLIDGYKRAATDADLLQQIAPIYHLDFVAVPVQIHIGTRDGFAVAGTPPAWSEKLYQALVAAGKKVEIYHYDGQGHIFQNDARDVFLQRVVLFFNRYVRNAK
jgi:dipeptidyl aminopeptidase/acylaminoacyl peptidase